MKTAHQLYVEKTIRHAHHLVCVLPQYARPDLERVVLLAEEQANELRRFEFEVQAQAEHTFSLR